MGHYHISRIPWTHYFIHEDGRITGFTLDLCETCGGPIQAANAITLVETEAALGELGLIRLFILPSEGYHDEESGMEVCDNCPI